MISCEASTQYFEPIYFLYGAIMTILPMIIGFVIAKNVLKLPLLNNLGSLTGGMTSTPALGTLINMAGTEDIASAYAATYPNAIKPNSSTSVRIRFFFLLLPPSFAAIFATSSFISAFMIFGTICDPPDDHRIRYCKEDSEAAAAQ